MIKCAIIEDDATQAAALERHIEKFGIESGEFFEVKSFSNAVTFLENYTADFDVAFIDIRMPYIDGMQAAKLLRKKDERILIVFVTSLAQYAIDGYSVNATDYVLKPVEYAEFALTMARVMRKLNKKRGRVYPAHQRGQRADQNFGHTLCRDGRAQSYLSHARQRLCPLCSPKDGGKRAGGQELFIVQQVLSCQPEPCAEHCRAAGDRGRS